MTDFRKYSLYELEDFIEDMSFRNWIKFPSDDNERYWTEFLRIHPDKQKIVLEAREFLLEVNSHFEETDLSKEDVQNKLDQILFKVSENKADVKSTENRIKKFWPIYYRQVVAASVIFVIGFLGWYQFADHSGLTTYSTDYGEWKSVTLPDGSKVNLNAHSELVLAEDWSEGVTRQVWLKGEAFFQVTKKPSTGAKFQVITNDLTVEVLGTEFNVLDRGTQTEVFLKEGKITLDLGTDQETLVPGDFISFSAEKNEIIEHKQVSHDVYTSWRDGVLQLDNTTVYEILREVEEIYGVEVRISNKALLKEKRTIAIPMKNLEIVVPILEKTLNAEISREKNKLFIR